MTSLSTTNLEGVLPLDKPSGLTSHDVVDRVRRKLRIKRVGHAGTLDPMATGLLLILVGKATKLSQHLMGLDKSYAGTMKLGVTTESHDVDSEIVEERPVPALSNEELKEVVAGFMGDQYQLPPMYSAKKVDGVPLYKLARKGKTVEREPRFIRVSRYDITRFESPEVDFFVSCSKGTYVRTLAHDLGEKLGCGAHLTALRRTAIERFSVEDAVTLEAFEELTFGQVQRALIPPYRAVPSNVL